MSKALTHIIVAAYIEELESVGFFLETGICLVLKLPIIGTY